MEVSGEVADLLVKEGLEVTSEAAKLAGKGVVNVTALLAALLKQNYKTVGHASVERLNRENAEAVIVPLKQEDRKQFKTLAKKYGVLYVAVKKRGEDTGIIDIISNANYAAQLNAVFEAMGYPIPQKKQTQEEQAAKKANPRAPQETRSVERGNGSKQPTTPTADKPSVRSRLEVLRKTAQEQGRAPARQHEITR